MLQFHDHALQIGGVQEDQPAAIAETDLQPAIDIAPDIDCVYETALDQVRMRNDDLTDHLALRILNVTRDDDSWRQVRTGDRNRPPLWHN